jgi:hypothetical protein
MSVECTSCGHLIADGQVRCGKCGEPAPRELKPTAVAGQPATGAADAKVPFGTSAARAIEDAHEAALEAPVPKGTFASVAPQATPAFAARPEPVQEPAPAPEARPPAVPREYAEPSVKDPAQSSSQRLKQARPPVRPPFLASESLREDLSPLWPGKQTIRYTLQAAGALGAFASVLVAFDQPVGWLCALACVAMAALSRVQLDYQKRALFVAALAGSALAAVSASRVALGAGSDDPLLVLACSLLPAALLFRSWYRGARIARGVVGLTLALAFAWAALTSHRGLLALGFTWQSWLPALAWSLFCLLCLLSLLAFMGDETTGGCHVWAYGISLWFGLFACLRWAMERDGLPELNGSAAALGLAEAAFASALAIALAQLGARVYVARSRLMPNAS